MIYITGLFLVIIVAYQIWVHNHNIKLIESVTSLDRGTEAERKLILKLLKYGIKSGAIFHDLYLKTSKDKFSQIDLVVATKVGIIVIEVKDYSGWIFGKGYDDKWTKVLAYGREKYRFYNPIKQNNSHINQLKKKLGEDVPFFSVIAFYGDCELEDISFIPEGTFVTKGYRVIDVIDDILYEYPDAKYKNKRNVINILKEAVSNGEDLDNQEQHVENIIDMLGEDRVFK